MQRRLGDGVVSSLLGIVLLVSTEVYPPQYRFVSPEVEHDCKRFPCKWVAAKAMELAEEDLDYLQARLLTEPGNSDEIAVLRCQAQFNWSCWWALHYAWVIPTRAEDMEQLRKAIGDEAYYKGMMPAPSIQRGPR